MISKWLTLIIVIFLIYWVLKNLQRARKQPTQPNNVIEDMVRCTHCSLHIPRSEGIAADDKYFCSTDHRQLHAKSTS